MGLGFVIIVHLIALTVLSGLVAAISVPTTFLISKNNEKRKRRIFLAVFLPFQFFYTLYIIGLIGSIIVSEVKDIDMGIGDSFYVPVNEYCKIQMIDVLDNAYLECGGTTVKVNVSSILPTEEKIFGKTKSGKFFCYEISTSALREYANLSELSSSENSTGIQLIEIREYYHKQSKENAGTALVLVGIISLVATVVIMWLTRKVVLKLGKRYL
jgi:hypothetical protein